MPEVVWKFDAQGGRFVKATLDESEKITLKLEKSIKRLEDRATLKKAQEGSEKYQTALKQVRGEIEKTATAQKSMGANMVIVANQAVQLAQELWQMANAIKDVAAQGAQVQALADSFTRLGGTQAQLAAVRDALAGTVDDATIMKMINTAKSLGVAEDQIASLARVAKIKSAEIGQEVGFLFESLVTGVARKSLPIIDNAGIMMKGATEEIAAQVKILGEQGELTGVALETAAFGATVLARSGVDLSKDIPAATDSIARFDAELQNLKNTIAQQIAEEATPLMATAMDRLKQMFAENEGALKGLLSAGGDSAAIMFEQLAAAVEILATGMKVLAPVMKVAGVQMAASAKAMGWLADILDLAVFLVEDFGREFEELTGISAGLLTPLTAIPVAIDAIKDAYDRLTGNTESLIKKTEELTYAQLQQLEATRRQTEAEARLSMQRAAEAGAAKWREEQDKRIKLAKEELAAIEERHRFEAKWAAEIERDQQRKGTKAREEQDPNIAFLASFQDRRSELEQARDFIVSAQQDIADAYAETTARLADQLQQRREMEEETANSVANIMGRMNAAVDSSRAARMEEYQAQQAYISGIGGFVNAVAGAAGANAWVTAILGASQETALGLGALATPGMQESAFLHFASAAQHIVTQGIASQFKSGGGGGSAARASASASAVAPRPPADLTGERGGGEGMVLMVDGRVLGEASVKGANKSSRFTGITLDQRISGRRGRTIGG